MEDSHRTDFGQAIFMRLAAKGHWLPPNRVSLIGLAMLLNVEEKTASKWVKDCNTPTRKLGAKTWISLEDLWQSMPHPGTAPVPEPDTDPSGE